MISYEWRGRFENGEVNRLHAEGFEHRVLDWTGGTGERALARVGLCAARSRVGRVRERCLDGDVHAFVLDTVVAGSARHHGIGTGLVKAATEQARAAGCEWLHVDFEDHLRGFYFDGCGFRPTNAGLIPL